MLRLKMNVIMIITECEQVGSELASVTYMYPNLACGNSLFYSINRFTSKLFRHYI